MKVYLVGSLDVESCDIRHVCLSKKTALIRWEEIRQELIERETELLKEFPDDETSLRCMHNLQEKDPVKMNNWPQEEPFIREMEMEE